MKGVFLFVIYLATLINFSKNRDSIKVWDSSRGYGSGWTGSIVKGNCDYCKELEPVLFKRIEVETSRTGARYYAVTLDSSVPFTCIKIYRGYPGSYYGDSELSVGGPGHRYVRISFRMSYKFLNYVILAYNVNCSKEYIQQNKSTPKTTTTTTTKTTTKAPAPDPAPAPIAAPAAPGGIPQE